MGHRVRSAFYEQTRIKSAIFSKTLPKKSILMVSKMLPGAAILIAMAGLASQAGAQEWIEFETIDQSALPIVRADLNGIRGHRLVLDVGFNDLLLDTMLVDGAGMKLAERGEVQEIDFYGRTERVPVAYVQTLSLGTAEFQLVRTLLIEGEDGTGAGGLRSYGRIGRDILEPLRLTIHYPRHLLYMEASPAEDVPAGSVTFEGVGRFLLVPVVLSGEEGPVEATFVLDPGTSTSLMDKSFAEKNGLAPKRANETVVSAVDVGGFHAESVPVLLGDIRQLPYDGQAVGVIGADVMSSISVTYDFARDLVWLTRLDEDAS